MENFLLFGYVFIFFVCLWFGNFITSFYFRIPRNIPLNGKTHPPMCSTCKVRLKYPDYGPLYYYIFRSKKCKVCGSPIPAEYFWIELLTATTLLTVFFFHGITEKACFMALCITTLILCFLINCKHGFIPEKALWLTFVATAVYVVFSLKNENDILYMLITNASIGFIFGFILKKYVEGNFGLKQQIYGNGDIEQKQNQLPQGYVAILAIISMLHTNGVSILLFTLVYLLLMTKRIKLKYLISIVIGMSILVTITDISFPYLSL